MENKYSKAYKEIYEILNTLPKEDVEKIPLEMREMFKAKMDTEYNFKIDLNKTFEEQNFSEITKAILANIFRDYWATPYQRKKIIVWENQERKKIEEKKKQKYNSDNIFKNKNRINNIEQHSQEEKIEKYNKNLLIEYKKQNVLKKLILKIKKYFWK